MPEDAIMPDELKEILRRANIDPNDVMKVSLTWEAGKVATLSVLLFHQVQHIDMVITRGVPDD